MPGPSASVAQPDAMSEPSAAAPTVVESAAPAPPVSVVPKEAVDPPKPMKTDPVGALELPQLLVRLFEALAKLKDGTATSDVRFTQHGDSHTAADFGTGTARRALQLQFGDGGRGFVAMGQPWKGYTQNDISAGMTGFVSVKTKYSKGKFSGDGIYGLGGGGIEGNAVGSRAWTSVRVPTSQFEIAYLKQPKGGSFDVFVDGAKVGQVSTDANAIASGFSSFSVDEADHKIEVRLHGDGKVRIFGVVLDRAANGVTFDSLGINGAQIISALRWKEKHLIEQVNHRGPTAFILAYGTNESTGMMPAEEYETKLKELIHRFTSGAPNASCILLGPPDRAVKRGPGEWRTAPRILEVIASQRRVAKEVGCAFYDQLAAMGGPGSIAKWANERKPRATRDHVHLTKKGYTQLAESFVTDLVTAYEQWQAK